MEVNLKNSTANGKPPTGGEQASNPGQALEILQAACRNCQRNEIVVRLVPLYDNGQQLTAIVLDGVMLENGMLVCRAINGNGAEAEEV
jgi:hypothetical protein